MKFFRLPGSTKKTLPFYFDGMNPVEPYKPSQELGNYHWCFFSQKIVEVEVFQSIQNGINPKIIEKIPTLSIDSSIVISFKEFSSFLIANYKGWAPLAKGMSEEKAAEYSEKLIKSFLSCAPEKAIYIKYNHIDQQSNSFIEFEISDRPIMISGVVGVIDVENGEYFKLVMGGYDAYNQSCNSENSPHGELPIKFCPIRKIPIRFHAYDQSLMNQDYIEELGNYRWFLYQFRIKEDDISVGHLQKDEQFRSSIPPVGRFKSSLVVSYKDFLSFLITNYKGWAPYAKGMSEEKAAEYSEKLIKSFLSCAPEKAIYVKYEGWEEINEPYLINGVVCIFDQENNEFFELIMGGTD